MDVKCLKVFKVGSGRADAYVIHKFLNIQRFLLRRKSKQMVSGSSGSAGNSRVQITMAGHSADSH